MEQMRNESRASTPSKDSNTSQSTASSIPTTSAGLGNKSDAGSTSSTTTNSTSTTTTSRANRKSTQSAAATARPGTPSEKKEDTTAAETTEDEAVTPVAPKKKRMSEQRPSLTGSDVADKTTAPPTTPSTPTTEPAPCVESEEAYAAKLEVKIKIPDELKHYLTDDWYAVVREHKLLELPAKITVQQISEQYLAHKKSVNAGGDEEVRREHEGPPGGDAGVGVRQSQVRGHRKLGEQAWSASLGRRESALGGETLDIMFSEHNQPIKGRLFVVNSHNNKYC